MQIPAELITLAQLGAAGTNVAMLVATALNTMSNRDLKQRIVRLENHLLGDAEQQQIAANRKAKAHTTGRD